MSKQGEGLAGELQSATGDSDVYANDEATVFMKHETTSGHNVAEQYSISISRWAPYGRAMTSFVVEFSAHRTQPVWKDAAADSLGGVMRQPTQPLPKSG